MQNPVLLCIEDGANDPSYIDKESNNGPVDVRVLADQDTQQIVKGWFGATCVLKCKSYLHSTGMQIETVPEGETTLNQQVLINTQGEVEFFQGSPRAEGDPSLNVAGSGIWQQHAQWNAGTFYGIGIKGPGGTGPDEILVASRHWEFTVVDATEAPELSQKLAEVRAQE